MLRIEYFDKERFMRQLSASHGSVLLDISTDPDTGDRKSTRLNSSHSRKSRMPSSA